MSSINYMKVKLNPLKQWLNSQDCLDRYNEITRKQHWENNAKGSISKWEMDSLSFYYHEHELSNVDNEKYEIVPFNEIKDSNDYTPNEIAEFNFSMYKEKKYPQYPLSRIVGTVLDKDKVRHTISLLTPTGVVIVKYYSGNFSHYDKQISINVNGKKETVEKSWFTRGNLLSVVGYRKGDQFKPKKYRGSGYAHTTMLIEDVREDRSLELKTDRTRI